MAFDPLRYAIAAMPAGIDPGAIPRADRNVRYHNSCTAGM